MIENFCTNVHIVRDQLGFPGVILHDTVQRLPEWISGPQLEILTDGGSEIVRIKIKQSINKKDFGLLSPFLSTIFRTYM